MNNSTHSLVHESIYESHNNQPDKNNAGNFILESKVVPMRLQSRKSNEMDLLKTGKSFTKTNVVQNKISL